MKLILRPEGAVPFNSDPSTWEKLGSAPSGRVGIGGTSNLALKHQANQMPPLRGEGRDKPRRF
jgi:hypothetical protein